MKTIEQTRRELFQSLNDGEHLGLYDGKYEDPIVEAKWQGFNAALDAVLIELPVCEQYGDEDMHGASCAIQDCRTAIESTSLGLKIR